MLLLYVSTPKITEKVVLQQLLAYLTEHMLICPQSAYRPHPSTETALPKITNDILLHLTPAMFLFWHSWVFQLPFTQLTTAYFLTDSNKCIASPVLHSSMTTSQNSQAFPMVCDRVLCWAQFSSFSTQNLFLSWFSGTLLSLNLSRTQLQVSVPPSNIQSAISFSGKLSVRHLDLDAGIQT